MLRVPALRWNEQMFKSVKEYVPARLPNFVATQTRKTTSATNNAEVTWVLDSRAY